MKSTIVTILVLALPLAVVLSSCQDDNSELETAANALAHDFHNAVSAGKLERILQIVDYPLKTACCGGAHTLSDSDTSTLLVLNLLDAAEEAGADVIATECPTCHSGLEMHQVRAEKVFLKKTKVKVLYFTQLLGLALGLSPRKVGVHENISDSMALLKQKGLA